MLALVLLAMSMTGCSLSGGDECSWVRRISPDSGSVLSDPVKRQILAHNLKVQEFCRRG